MPTTTNFGWTTPADTDLVKNGALAIRTLAGGIDTSMVGLKGGTTGQILSKTSNTDMAFTWITNDVGDITAVTAGTGISGGGTSGDVTITNSMATTIDAKGDLIAGTANDTFARLAVGSNGDTLVANSAATTGLGWNPPVGSLANPIINGGFDIWQRGTSFGNPNASYTADRWLGSANASFTVSRQNVSDSTNLPNIQYAIRLQRNNGATTTSELAISQSLETVNSIPFAGKTITLSFYARAGANFSPASSQISARLSTGTGTDQNIWTAGYTGSATPITQLTTLTTTWQRFAISGTLASTTTEFGLIFGMTGVGTAGANDWFEITGIQIDVGTWTASTAPTFRRTGATLAGELAACQRYYVRFAGTGSNTYGQLAMAFVRGTTTADTFFALPVRMRVAPTSFEYSTLAFREYTGTQRAISAATLDGGTTVDAGYVNFTIATSTAGYGGTINQSGSSSAYAAFSSEL